MQTFTYKINDALGIHARPAGLLVKCISSFPAATTISVNGKSADGKRLFALMGLGVKQNDEITVAVDGEREAEAAEAIKKFLTENLYVPRRRRAARAVGFHGGRLEGGRAACTTKC